MKHIAVIPNKRRDTEYAYTKNLLNLLRGKAEIYMYESEPVRFDGVLYTDEETLAEKADIAIVLGGDGSILAVAEQFAIANVPIMGINLGHLGFLAAVERENMAQAIEALLVGDYRVERRSMLHATIVRPDGAHESFDALNDIVISRAAYTKLLNMQVYTDGILLDEFVADGVIISTATGSTAYSLSAGGAILTPEVPVFMMTPICAFSMRARPIVFSDTDEFKITVAKGRSIVLADGGVLAALPEGAEIYVKKAPFTADFPVKENSDFFARVRNKLNG